MIEEVTYYIAQCDKCKDRADYPEFGAYDDYTWALEAAVNDLGWLEQTRVIGTSLATPDKPRTSPITETVGLLCTKCISCDVCGTKKHVFAEDGHVLCREHEEHEFPEDVLWVVPETP